VEYNNALTLTIDIHLLSPFVSSTMVGMAAVLDDMTGYVGYSMWYQECWLFQVKSAKTSSQFLA
jgi:hypothetical protein